LPKVVIDSKMYYYDAGIPKQGSNCAIIFIHGAGGSHKHWTQQTAELGKNFLTIAVDLPGHGDSESEPFDQLEGYSNFLYDFAERVLGTKFVLASHSMGGAIALDFALRFPSQLSGLVLIGTGARMRVTPRIMEIFAPGKSFPEFNTFTNSAVANSEVFIQAGIDPIYYHDFLFCDGFDYMDRIKYIGTPTLVIGASEDPIKPPRCSQYLAARIPNSQLVIIEQAGHLMMLEKPQQVNAHIEQFITSMVTGGEQK